jgi:hypothetical protein
MSKKIEKVKVQCVSTKYGFYSNIKLGNWYEALICEFPASGYYEINGQTYEFKLFKTIDQRREERLNKILK